MIPASLLLLAAAAVATSAPQPVGCELNDRPLADCRLTDRIAPDGTHALTFRGGGRVLRFVGRAGGGWWAGTLDGRPAMGYERNRGNVVLMTRDLRTSLTWWYPGQEHGTY